MIEHLPYNLPGVGLVRVKLFPHARRVFEFLDQYGHIKHLKKVDHLGSIRQVLPSAHHTRYEYLMIQCAIITELCHLEGQLPEGISLSRRRDDFGNIKEISENSPSHGEILQVLALLGNIGHLPSTFSGERAFMKYLRDNVKIQKVFRTGLPDENHALFDIALEKNQFYRFNYYIALFLLNRYRRRDGSKPVVDFCQKILCSFTESQDASTDQGLKALWELYRSIRRLAYLALDSHYAPVPLSLNIGAIFLSLRHFLTDVFLDGSAFQDTLQRLEVVMRDMVYMQPLQLLNHAYVGDILLEKLEDLQPQPTSINLLWNMLGPSRSVNKYFSTPVPTYGYTPDIDHVVQLSYDLNQSDAQRLLPDPIKWERDARKFAGSKSCRFAADLDPTNSHLKVTAGLLEGVRPNFAPKVANRIIKRLVSFDKKILESDNSLSVIKIIKNKSDILRFFLPFIFGRNRDYQLRFPHISISPIVYAKGSTHAADLIQKYKISAEESDLFDKDEINEVIQLEEFLRKIRYHGELIAFAGSTEVLQGGKALAEFDGLAVFLSRSLEKPILMIVEAKNIAHGHTKSKRQLKDQFDRLGICSNRYRIHHLSNKGAYAEVTIN